MPPQLHFSKQGKAGLKIDHVTMIFHKKHEDCTLVYWRVVDIYISIKSKVTTLPICA